MKTKVKALTSFMHGRVHAHLGDELEVTKGEADELEKAGLVNVVKGETDAAGSAQEPAEESAPAAPEEKVEAPSEPAADNDDVNDLLGGGEKMNAAPENKMDAEPKNKAGESKSTPLRKK